jgi:hypothetical protein
MEPRLTIARIIATTGTIINVITTREIITNEIGIKIGPATGKAMATEEATTMDADKSTSRPK